MQPGRVRRPRRLNTPHRTTLRPGRRTTERARHRQRANRTQLPQSRLQLRPGLLQIRPHAAHRHPRHAQLLRQVRDTAAQRRRLDRLQRPRGPLHQHNQLLRRRQRTVRKRRGGHDAHPMAPRSAPAPGAGHDHTAPDGVSRATRPTLAGSTQRRSTPNAPTRCRSAADSRPNVRQQSGAAQWTFARPVHTDPHAGCRIAPAGIGTLAVAMECLISHEWTAVSGL